MVLLFCNPDDIIENLSLNVKHRHFSLERPESLLGAAGDPDRSTEIESQILEREHLLVALRTIQKAKGSWRNAGPVMNFRRQASFVERYTTPCCGLFV